LGEQRPQLRRSVEHRVLGVHVEMDELLRHEMTLLSAARRPRDAGFARPAGRGMALLPALFDTRSPTACRAKAPPVVSGLQPSPCDRGGAPARGARCRRPQCRGRNGEAPARLLGRPRRGSPRPLPTWSSTGFAKLSTGGKSIIALLWSRTDTYAMNITETDISIKGPSDLVCTVPLLLGFHPEHSLVVVGLSGSDLKCTFRIDLPGSADHIEHLLDLTGQLCRNGCDRCVL